MCTSKQNSFSLQRRQEHNFFSTPKYRLSFSQKCHQKYRNSQINFGPLSNNIKDFICPLYTVFLAKSEINMNINISLQVIKYTQSYDSEIYSQFGRIAGTCIFLRTKTRTWGVQIISHLQNRFFILRIYSRLWSPKITHSKFQIENKTQSHDF